MSTQVDVDVIKSRVDQVTANLATARKTLQAEIDSLAQGNPQLDLDGLEQAAAQLESAAEGLGDLHPDNLPAPATEPAPAPEPAPADQPASQESPSEGQSPTA